MLFVELVAIVVFVVLLVKYGKFRVMTKKEFADYQKQRGNDDDYLDGWKCGTSLSCGCFRDDD